MKYNNLSKEEKMQVRKEFYKTELGKNIKTRLDRVFIYGNIALIFSTILFFIRSNISELITSIILFCAGIFFIIASFKVRTIKINEYLVKKK